MKRIIAERLVNDVLAAKVPLSVAELFVERIGILIAQDRTGLGENYEDLAELGIRLHGKFDNLDRLTINVAKHMRDLSAHRNVADVSRMKLLHKSLGAWLKGFGY